MNGSMVGLILCIAMRGYSCNTVRQCASSFSKLVLDEAVFCLSSGGRLSMVIWPDVDEFWTVDED